MKTLGLGMALAGLSVIAGCNSHAEPPPLEKPLAETPAEVVWLDDAKTVRMEFRLVKAGTFMMGHEDGKAEKRPPHGVKITKDYWMQTTEVTQAQWDALMDENPSSWKGADRPVNKVSWDDCQAFLTKLNARLAGRTAALPTEAEWEYACRAGSMGKWCCGDDEKALLDYAWIGKNSGNESHSVGTKKANAWGFHDMHGNVWEWCHDWYGPFRGTETDPTGPAEGVARVWRGASCYSEPQHARSAHSLWCAPDFRSEEVGFRVAMR